MLNNFLLFPVARTGRLFLTMLVALVVLLVLFVVSIGPVFGEEGDLVMDSADIEVRKSVSNPSPAVGELITYTVSVLNNGPDIAHNVVVSDLLPAELTYLGSIFYGTYTAATGEWVAPSTIFVGRSFTLTIKAKANAGTAGQLITNTARLISLDETDTVTSNDVATAEITPVLGSTDLRVAISVSDANPEPADTVLYIVEVGNHGTIYANNAVISSSLTSPLIYTGYWSNGGPYTSATGAWNMNSIPPGITRTLRISAFVPLNAAGSVWNDAIFMTADELDSDSSNNSASVEIIIGVPNAVEFISAETSIASVNTVLSGVILLAIGTLLCLQGVRKKM